MFKIPRYFIILALSATLVSCDNESGSDRHPTSVVSTSELARLYASGDFLAVINAIDPKEKVGQADDRDFLISAKAYLGILDVVGASLQLEKISDNLRNSEDFILTHAKILILEGKALQAANLLKEREFSDPFLAEAELVKGDLAFFRRAYEESHAHYSKAIATNPTDPRFLVARAQSNMALGDLKAAESDALKAVLRRENSTLAHYTLGVIANRSGRLADAADHFRDALVHFENNIAARLELVGIDILQGNLENAAQSLDKVFAIAPDNNTAKFFSHMLAAVSGADKEVRAPLAVLQKIDDSNPQVQRLLGHVAYRLGDDKTARQQLESALAAAPYDRVSRLALGDVYLRLGMPQQALVILTPLTDAPEQDDLAAFALAGQAAALSNDLDLAITYTNRTIELATSPGASRDDEIIASNIDGSSLVIFNRKLATYHFQNNEPAQSVTILEALVKSDSDDIASALMLCNFQMELGNLDKALMLASNLTQKKPAVAAGYNAKAAALHRLGKYAEALADYDRAIEINGDYISARQNRGALLLQLKRYDAAAEDLQRVLDEFPGDLHTQLMFAQALVGADDAARSLPYFEKLTTASPGSWRVAYYFASALAATAEFERAIVAVERAISLNEDGSAEELNLLSTALEDYKSKLAEKTTGKM